MGRLGFGKKDDAGEDSNRLALFGSRTKSKSPAPPTENPYAGPAIPPNPYTQAKLNAGIGRPPNGPPASQQGAPPGRAGNAYGQPWPQQGYGADNRYGGPQSGYGNGNQYAPPQGGYSGAGYGNNSFGNQNPYGAPSAGGNPYVHASPPTGASRGPSGYGGLGRVDSGDTTTTDANREELFGGVRDRVQQKQQNNPNGPPGYEYNSGGGAGQERNYGAYGDRQLTAEEEEEEDIQATKQDIKFMKQQDVSSTSNALRIAQEAEESGRNTLAMLGDQGERLHATDRNMDLGNNHLNAAEDRAKELKVLNRGLFAVHVENPFNAKSRKAEKDEKIMERHRNERDQRDATREAALATNQRMNQNFKGLTDAYSQRPDTKVNLAERSKYQFDADSDDDRMEDEIDRNLDDLALTAKRLNMLGRAMGDEVEQQNRLLTSIGGKSDRLDDRVHMQTEKLKRYYN